MPNARPLPDSDLMSFRIRLGFTLRKMSKETGLSAATIHRLERGVIGATQRSKLKLQDGLKLTAAQVETLLRLSAEILPRYRAGGKRNSQSVEEKEGC